MPLSLSFGLWSPGRQMILPLGFNSEIFGISWDTCAGRKCCTLQQKPRSKSSLVLAKSRRTTMLITEKKWALVALQFYPQSPLTFTLSLCPFRSLWLVTRSSLPWRCHFWTPCFYFSPTSFAGSDLFLVEFNRLLLAPLVRQRRSRKPSKKPRLELRWHQVCLNKNPFHLNGLVKLLFQVNVDTKHNTLSGLAFPLQQQATDSIKEYCQGGNDYVQLAIGRKFAVIDLNRGRSIFCPQISRKRLLRWLRVVLVPWNSFLERSQAM